MASCTMIKRNIKKNIFLYQLIIVLFNPSENLSSQFFSEFTLFGEDIIQFPEMLKQITPQFRIFRREKTAWDSAFQLYSTLLFCKLISE